MRSLTGTKRVGLAALVAFLRLNGHRLICPVGEEIAMVQKAAASEVNEDEWTAWVESVVGPL
jgi:prophage maintenance system killer protein